MLKNFIILLFSIFLLCGCTKKQTPNVLTFTSWGSVTETKILKKIISDFESENPDIKINFIHTPQNYFQKLHLLFASNSAPDVIFINNYFLPLYESQLIDLSEYIDRDAFYPQAIECLSYNKKILAIPRDISTLVLYINKDIIKTQPLQTMEDLLLTAQNATKEDVFGLSYEEDIYWVTPYLSYFGEEFDANFNPKTSKGFNFYKDLRDIHKVCPRKSQIGSLTLAQMFLDKKIAIYLSGRWMFPKIEEEADFDWEIKSFPKGIKNLPCDASGWAISKQSKNKELAIQFIKYLSSEKSAKYFTKSGLIVPARIETSKMLSNDKHNEKVFLEIIKNSNKTNIPKNYKKLADKFNSENFN